MKRQLISFASLLCILPMLAYDRYGRNYTLKGGGGSSGFLMIIVIVAFVLYCIISVGNKTSLTLKQQIWLG